MAKIQLMAFLSLDGCLLERQSLSALQDSAEKYGITRIRKKAVRHLEGPVSFVSLSRWKEEGDGIALVEACPDTLPLVDSLEWRLRQELPHIRTPRPSLFISLRTTAP